METQAIDARFGLFTASEIHRLLASGTRPMIKEELEEEKAKGGKRKTVDVLFGDGAMTYIYEKVAQCITGESKPQIRSAATDWGLENEADAVLWFEHITGLKGQHFGAKEYKFFNYNSKSGCSPDWLLEGVAGLQVKCPYVSANHIPYLLSDKSAKWLKSYAPDYYTQTQFEMMCLKVPKMYFATYDPRTLEAGHRMVLFVLEKDEELHKELDMRITEASKIVSQILNNLSLTANI